MTATDTQLLPIVDGQVTLSPGDFGAPFDDTLQRVTGGTPIVIAGATRTTDGAVVTVTGTTSLLNAVQIQATLTAQPGTNGPTLTARFALPATPPYVWQFSTSFTSLPPFPAGINPQGQPPAAATDLLDRLTLSDAAFFINTLAGATDAVTGATLPLGFGFAGWFTPAALLGLAGQLIPGGTTKLPLAGPILLPLPHETTPALPTTPLPMLPWDASWPVPGINLVADLGGTTLGSKLSLTDVGFHIYSPSDSTWLGTNPGYDPVTAGSATFAIPSAGITAQVNVIGMLTPRQLTVTGAFQGITFQRLEDLVDAAGTTDLPSSLPDDVSSKLSTVLGQLELEAVSVSVGTGFGVGAVSLAIGIPHLDTQVLPGFTIGSLSASFTVTNPFDSATRGVDVVLGGAVELFGAPFDIEVDLGSGIGVAELSGPISVSLSQVAAHAGLTVPADIPDLTVDSMRFSAGTNGAMGFEIALADAPNPWTLPLGPVSLTVSDVQAIISKPAQGGTSAQFGGTLTIGGATFGFSYNTPGDFMLSAVIDEISLVALARQLTGDSLDFIPSGFDLTLDASSVLIQKQGSDLHFALVTLIEESGMVGLDVQRQNGSWGFAFGLDLIEPRLSSLPGLSGLASLENIFAMDELQLIVASFDNADFQFLPASDFAGIALPPGPGVQLSNTAGGVIRGLNAHGSWTINLDAKDQKLLHDLLGLKTQLEIVLQIGADPAANSALSVQIATTLCGMPITGAFGGRILNNDVSLFLAGTLQSQIGGQTQNWSVSLQVFPNGVLFSGGMRGTVTFDGLQLSNLALVIGCDWEGIPSFGIAGALTAGAFHSSLAIFFNSEDPAQSLLAGSVSDLTLADVVDTFTGGQTPPEIDEVLKQIGLVGTAPFTIPASTGTALDTLDLGTVAAAFQTAGVTLPTSSEQVLINVGAKDANGNGTLWFVTNLADDMKHYTAKLSGQQITVTLDPQLYLAPAAVSLAGVQYNQGFFLNGTLEILSFTATVTITVDKTQGIAVDGSMSKIVIGTPWLFALENVEGTGGPDISIATFTQPQEPPERQPPHALVDAKMSMLGLSRELFVTIEKDGFSFLLEGSLLSAASYSLTGHFTGFTDLGIGGSVGLNLTQIDLGPLGTVDLGVDLEATADIGVSGSHAWANFTAHFSLLGKDFSPSISLDVTKGDLESLSSLFLDEIKKLLNDFFADAKTWALAVWQDIVKGIADLEQALMSEFGLSKVAADAIIATLGAIGGCAMVAGLGAVGALGAPPPRQLTASAASDRRLGA